MPAVMAIQDTQSILDGVLREMAAGEPSWLEPLSTAAGIPAIDVSSTVLSTRAAMLGFERGRGFSHHELRVRATMPAGLEPEVAVWDGDTVPDWDGGVLTEPKYFSFFQDGPVPVYNPNYRGKWRPHELLHGAVGFFWHPEMTRFEFYVSARASESVPVLHWYHFDEVLRPRCREHQAGGALRVHCARCERARRPFWAWQPASEDLAAAAAAIDSGRAHLAGELGACRQELASGLVVPWPCPGLNSTSDAQGYLRSHWNRSTAWSFGAWTELFLSEGEDYVSTVSALVDRAEAMATQLLEPVRQTSVQEFQSKFQRRGLQDLGYRILLELEGLGEEHPAQDILWPRLEAAGEACALTLAGNPDLLLPAREGLVDAARAHDMAWTSAQGLPDVGRSTAEVRQIEDGLRSVFAMEVRNLEAFVASKDFWRPGRLANRYADFSGDADLGFQAWLRDDPRSDPEAELFGGVPLDTTELERGRLRLSETFRRGSFPASVLESSGDEQVDESSGDEQVDIAATIWSGEARVVEIGPTEQSILDWLSSGSTGPPPHPETIQQLIEAGAIIWFPPTK
jgi:hypothetical protein